MQSMQKRRAWYLFLFFVGISATTEASAPDTAAQEAAGIVAGLQSGAGGKVIYNEKTDRVEVRDEQGSLVDEIVLGTAGKAIDVAGQEYRLSFGKDENSKRSVLVRPGPAMQKPVTLEVFGRKAVLSPEASLLATMGETDQVFYEPSLCGQVYYLDKIKGEGGWVSRIATPESQTPD